MSSIKIRGARTHNLKNIDLDLPRDKLVVLTGLSGSGKSSLAFDTLYAEGQRRYVESLSSYARQFLSMMDKPDVDLIEGLSPAISIEQKSTSHNPRSTVGTVTEIYDYLRLLYARVGQPRCPKHGVTLEAQTVSQMVDAILAMPVDAKLMILAPVVRERKGEFVQLFDELLQKGFIRARIDGELCELTDAPELNLRSKHNIEVVVDRLKVKKENAQRFAESLETALSFANGLVIVANLDNEKELLMSAKFACPTCGYSLTELEPRMFSFNSPIGACPSCDGLGRKQSFDPDKIIADPELSLAQGAIRGWDRRNLYYYSMLKSLAKRYEFDLEMPFNELSKDAKDVILHGSGKEKIKFSYYIANGRRVSRTHVFEGVINTMDRRYHETDSIAVREDLAKYLSESPCPDCGGGRLRLEARHVFIKHKSLPDVTAMSISDALLFFQKLKLPGKRGEIAEKILKEVIARLTFLINVGLEYLTLSRSAETLSGGEAQRIRLASQIGSGLVGVMYVLDEPTIGLHQRDNQRLLQTLTYLRDLGNSVIVVEHDEETILTADWIIDIGPGAGVHGGEIIVEGDAKKIMQNKKSLTGQYLAKKLSISVPKNRTPIDHKRLLRLVKVSKNNLKNIDVTIPVGLFTCVTGVSGSGKSSLINEILYPLAARKLSRSTIADPKEYKDVLGLSHFDKVVDIDQSPIGRTPRSNPATYTGLFTPIRELFSNTKESRARGYKVGRFSFNVKGGRCEACQGDGLIKVEMHFLSDMYVVCDQCHGKRYNRETLEVKYKGKSIADVLDMTVEDAFEFFAAIPQLKNKLQTLIDVGLGYIKLGQSATTLSGGEAQRIKLSKELSKRDTGRTLYILDEPTTGLHFHDVNNLLQILHRLRDHGNTVVVIEHNLDVIKTADWIIDLGPEGGDCGGMVVASGTPEDVVKVTESYTGQFLSSVI
ncbi:MAG: excinuclease ABC subunit UvrA [Gammaproteobacteria bacterium]|nr:excinuclease ABC subunit UvrA [Gammaproteobacteria bacterium]